MAKTDDARNGSLTGNGPITFNSFVSAIPQWFGILTGAIGAMFMLGFVWASMISANQNQDRRIDSMENSLKALIEDNRESRMISQDRFISISDLISNKFEGTNQRLSNIEGRLSK